jgi:LPS sulfotransferase NodH
VRREDTAAQAVSWARAIQTGRWHHWDAPEAHEAAHYDRAQIDALAREIRVGNAGWQAWFDRNDIRPLEVRFERLIADIVGATREVLAFLGLDAEHVPIVEQTRPRTPTDATADWLDRYRLDVSSAR